MNAEFKRINDFLIRAVKAGYLLCATIEDEWLAGPTNSVNHIMSEIEGLDDFSISVHASTIDRKRIGCVLCIIGNADDGSEVFADYTDKPEFITLLGEPQ